MYFDEMMTEHTEHVDDADAGVFFSYCENVSPLKPIATECIPAHYSCTVCEEGNNELFTLV